MCFQKQHSIVQYTTHENDIINLHITLESRLISQSDEAGRNHCEQIEERITINYKICKDADTTKGIPMTRNRPQI